MLEGEQSYLMLMPATFDGYVELLLTEVNSELGPLAGYLEIHARPIRHGSHQQYSVSPPARVQMVAGEFDWILALLQLRLSWSCSNCC